MGVGGLTVCGNFKDTITIITVIYLYQVLSVECTYMKIHNYFLNIIENRIKLCLFLSIDS